MYLESHFGALKTFIKWARGWYWTYQTGSLSMLEKNLKNIVRALSYW